ncbi:hypothetical protein DICPUDRAFT_97058 [Dictyostelium purpureum]|uniref:MAPEG family protein n=1 Tax=Dictyostelium purpureum TaxID=5786 RepID=F0ZDK3_DICPU|nr:uncharacterized protein DICPUDRAFT_97058 [Dictyostelium purpureum]EGC38014.1 hypothetical protein DICPUDRAFT_97058 [Dictyostelium purpureum]|eukprot:XP_003285498.1 hypothetical protein DICPUDRAFT_97058 [Dictyostelium purpureum]
MSSRIGNLNWIYPDYIVFPSVVASLGITLWTCQAYQLGVMRKKYNVAAPHVQGDPEFERVAHEYQNTSEGLGAIIPSTYMFSYFISPKWSLVLGGAWLFSKLMNCCPYCCKKEKESECVKDAHVIISHTSSFILLGGSMFGIAISLINRCKLLSS